MLLAYFDDCAALGAQTSSRLRPRSRPVRRLFRGQVRSPDGDVAPAALSGGRRGRAGQIGAGEHTDYGNITLLATDNVGGLEVRTRGGEWIAAPVVPGAFVVNIGDCLMRWTNDIYVSTPHRVVNRSGRERYSIAFFFDPNPDAGSPTIPALRAGRRKPALSPISAADYLKFRLDASKPAGM